MAARCWTRYGVAATFILWLAFGPALRAQTPSSAEVEPDCRIATAEAAFTAKHFAESASSLRAEIAAHPGCASAHYLLAESLLRLGSAKASLAEYTLSARLRTPTAADLRHVALDYVLLGDDPDARRWAARARDLAPGDAENWYVLGRIAYGDGDFPNAVADFEQALRLDPASTKAENNLGLAYEGLSRDQDAVAAYRKSIELGEQSRQPSEQPRINLAILLMHQSKASEALPLLLQAVTIAPRDVRAREQLGKLYLEARRLPEAQSEIEQAVALAPSESRLHFLLGQVYRREGEKEKASAEFARTAQLGGTRSTPSYIPEAPQ